jgi:hypothetical protein
MNGLPGPLDTFLALGLRTHASGWRTLDLETTGLVDLVHFDIG